MASVSTDVNNISFYRRTQGVSALILFRSPLIYRMVFHRWVDQCEKRYDDHMGPTRESRFHARLICPAASYEWVRGCTFCIST